MNMLEAEKWVWRIGILCAALGIFFALIKHSPLFALFDAGMGAWFTKCLAEITPKKRKK